MKKKQVKLTSLPRFINRIVKQGDIITRVVRNGNTNGEYILVEYIPHELTLVG